MTAVFEFMGQHPEFVLAVLILPVLILVVWAWPRRGKGGHRPGKHKR